MAAHRFVLVAWQQGDAAGVVERTGTRVRRHRVDGIDAGVNDRPVIIVKLVRKKEGARKSVVFGVIVAVVFVGADGRRPNPPLLRTSGDRPL